MISTGQDSVVNPSGDVPTTIVASTSKTMAAPDLEDVESTSDNEKTPPSNRFCFGPVL
jgi:hypothetical protein